MKKRPLTITQLNDQVLEKILAGVARVKDYSPVHIRNKHGHAYLAIRATRRPDGSAGVEITDREGHCVREMLIKRFVKVIGQDYRVRNILLNKVMCADRVAEKHEQARRLDSDE